jgi:hypothetical protein
VGFIGVSSHSFRRTALTMMSDNGTPLRVIQEVSGHRNLEQLQTYIEVRDEQVLGAVTGLSMLSPITETGKYTYPALEEKPTGQGDGNRPSLLHQSSRKLDNQSEQVLEHDWEIDIHSLGTPQ